MVYTASVVLEALSMYGIERLMADIRQFVPLVQAIPIPAVPWRPSPAISLMLKTVLRFVGPGDDLRSCRFTQMMEQRLENAFAEAEAIVMNSHSSLTVQILSTSQSIGSPAVSLIYVVYNGSVTLNGTTASDLLSQLTAELVGYFLFYPPLITAELEKPFHLASLHVSAVIQDVENSSLEGQYHSFASLMEERLAELFMVAHQQGVRFKRAATVGSYTVQMVSIRRVHGPKNPAEMTYYVQQNGTPLLGTSAAKLLNTVDSQTMALTLGYFVQLQAEAVVKNPPNNLWIIAAVLAPIGVVTLIIIIITTVLCHKNKSDFKSDPIGNVNPRVKPVQGFDYAKQHLGQQGGDEETLPVTQETMVLPHPIRDAPLSLDKPARQDGSTSKKSLNSAIRKRLLSEDGSVISSKSVKEVSGKGSGVQKATTQQKLPKEELRKSNGEKFYVFLFLADHYDSSSGSLQLISIKPIAAPPTYSCPASSDRSQDSAVFNGEVNFALKQKSDIEHYRNKLRLKAKRKGYYGIPSAEGKDSTKDLSQQHKYSHDRPSQVSHPTHRSRQSLNSPSPGGTEMDLLVMRERPRKGIRNSGYDTEPEIIEETDVDQLAGPHYFGCGRQIKGQSETSTLSSQPSIDEVRQQMHLLLEEAFSLASAGHSASSRHHHSHHQHPPLGPYGLGPVIPYSEVVTSAPGTTSQGLGGLQWVPAYRPDPYQCSLAKQAFRFTQLPEMALGSPPPPVPPRTGPPPELSLQRSSSDLGPKGHCSELSVPSQHDSTPHRPKSRAPLPPVTTEPIPNHSGNPMTAVYAIPASHTGYTGYFISTPPSSYHSPSWMSYPPEPEDVLPQWTESMPLPGYAEAFPHPHYPQGSPLLWHHRQAIQGGPNNPPSSSTAVSQQSLAEPGNLVSPDTPLSSLSTSALVKAIRDEVAKLAKKQADMCEFQV
uniref:KIAA1549 like n=1 Tax=Cyprinus carpio TaxID=7962 RepID=A0A8C1LU76_CYPCA